MSSFRKIYTVTRQAANSYVSGLPVDGATSTFDIQASIQPVSGEDMKTLPDGRNVNDMIKVYSDTNLQVSDEANRLEPDKLTWRGKVYECVSVDVRQMDVISHYKYYFSRVSQ